MGRLLDLARQAADERTAAPGTMAVTTQSRIRPSVADQADTLPDPAAESMRQRVLAMLAERPGIRYAVITDTDADPDAVIVALAVRGVGTCELRIPRQKWNPFLFLEAIGRHSVH